MTMMRHQFWLTTTAACVSMMCCSSASAQQTAANIRGIVIDQAGKPLAGATVTIRDERTGRVDVAKTSVRGIFIETGLQVGGPYTIVADIGAKTGTVENVRLSPGDSEMIRLTVAEDAQAIVVTGQISGSRQLNNGVGSTFSSADVANQPNLTRDIVSIISRDPLVSTQCEARDGLGSFCIAGANPRFSAFTIDGSPVRNDLALGFNTSPTTRSPISLDVVESVTVKASDYSVLASGFVGGLVNVTTKSGTNRFRGSAYYYRTGDDFVGDRAFGRTIAVPSFKEEEYGATLGGPIIRDRLFFFLGYEHLDSQTPVSFRAADQAAGRDPRLFGTITDLFRAAYGIDLGGRGETAVNFLKSDRYFAKIDAQIADGQRIALSFNRANESDLTNSPTVFANANSTNERELTTATGEWFARWSDNVASQMRVSYKRQVGDAGCAGPTEFPSNTFNLNPTALAGDPLSGLVRQNNFLNAGCQNFLSANYFADERFIGQGHVDVKAGDHALTIGGGYENYSIGNLFLQRGFGEFGFNNGARIGIRSPNSISYNNVLSNDIDDAVTPFGYGRLSLFAQDTWQLTPAFEVSGGLRYELFFQQRRPTRTPEFLAAYGALDTQKSVNGLDVLLPRASFAWKPAQNTRISGGVGIFAGGDPVVWLSNAYQPSQFSATLPAQQLTDLQTIPASLITTVARGGIPARNATIARDFRTPHDVKVSMRLDQKFDLKPFGLNLGTGYRFTAQALYSRSLYGFGFRDINQLRVQQIGAAPDGRPTYANLAALGQPDIVELYNTRGGESWILTAGLEKQFRNGLDLQVSYAYQDVTSVNAGTSSTAAASRESTVDADQNRPSVGRSPFEIRHNLTANIGYQHNFVPGLRTRLDIFGFANSGTPLSYTYQLSPNGNPVNDNSLFGRQNLDFPINSDPIYVPQIANGAFADPRVVFATGFDQAGFINFIAARGLQPGAIARRNSDTSRWNKRVDLRIQQDLPAPKIGSTRTRLKLTADFENFLGLIDSSLGEQYVYPSFNQAPTVRADLVSAADVAANGVTAARALLGNAPATVCTTTTACLYRYNSFINPANSLQDDLASIWRIRVGVRLEF